MGERKTPPAELQAELERVTEGLDDRLRGRIYQLMEENVDQLEVAPDLLARVTAAAARVGVTRAWWIGQAIREKLEREGAGE